MIDKRTKAMLSFTGETLSEGLPDFYGKITFNFYNGKYVSSNVEQTIKKNNLNEGVENGTIRK